MVRLGVVVTNDRKFIADMLNLNKDSAEAARHTGVFILETACNRIIGPQETEDYIPMFLNALAKGRAPRSE